jgi:DNA invertase Pin-like site-specific DNA recombinase
MAPLSIPAARYLRMSTEHQQYSLENQSDLIQKYAEDHGFIIVRTYSDAAKSGIVLRNRKGLQQLLKDVVSGAATFKTILVYDISRWGRFQDSDEAAHYEFLCKSAGIPVHYCAEPFANDSTLPSLIMKALKRTMAGEYSRELGVKIVAGQKRLIRLGYKQCGAPGYGLRRFLVSIDGTRSQQLKDGEYKWISNDRVILVPGPAEEVALVREIYRMFIQEHKTIPAIARGLNSRGIPYPGQNGWTYTIVHTILTHPKYQGFNVYGRTSSRLHTKTIRMPESEWLVIPNCFEPIIDPETFAQAQTILQNRMHAKSNEVLLADLKKFYIEHGRLTREMIEESPDLPSISTIRNRFGGLRAMYRLIGYDDSWGAARLERFSRLRELRENLMNEIVGLAPETTSIERRPGCWRSRLRLKNRLISVWLCPCIREWKETIRWLLIPSVRENRQMVLIVRMTPDNEAFKDFFLMPKVLGHNAHLKENDDRLASGVRFTDPNKFHWALQKLIHAKARRNERLRRSR